MADPQIIDIAAIMLPELSRPLQFGFAFTGLMMFFLGAFLLRGMIEDFRESGFNGATLPVHGVVTLPSILFWMICSVTLLAWAVTGSGAGAA